MIETFAKVPKSSEPKKIRFQVGDAMNLSDDIGQFDVIHAANLICRLPEPKKLLNRFPNLLNTGGVLIITTPCTWLGEFTKPDYFKSISSRLNETKDARNKYIQKFIQPIKKSLKTNNINVQIKGRPKSIFSIRCIRIMMI